VRFGFGQGLSDVSIRISRAKGTMSITLKWRVDSCQSPLSKGKDMRQGLGVWHCKAYALYGIGEQMRSHAGELCDGILSLRR
jgi:hypothetical protein